MKYHFTEAAIDTEKEEKSETDPPVESLRCSFCCKEEQELEIHTNTLHIKDVQEIKQKEEALLTLHSYANYMTRENSRLKKIPL